MSCGCRSSHSKGNAMRAGEIRDGLWLDPPVYWEQHAAKVAGSTWEIRYGREVATLAPAQTGSAGGSRRGLGYRVGRRAQDAVEKVHQALCDGYTDVMDADLSKYFDTIPHDQLLKSVARRVSDGKMLRLIKAWLKTPVEETDERGNRRMTGGRGSRMGTPQGGVISPLLATST